MSREQPTIRHELRPPAVWIDYGDGIWRGEALHVTIVTDIRATPLGRVDFGCTTVIGPIALTKKSGVLYFDG